MLNEKNNIPTLQAPFCMEDFMATLTVIEMALDSPKANNPDYRSYIKTQLRELYLKADQFDLFTHEVMAHANRFKAILDKLRASKSRSRKH